MKITLTNIRLWDGIGDDIDAGLDAVVIEDGTFSAIGTAGELDSRESRDMGGLYLIPGLIDAHVHLCLNPDIRAALEQDKVERDTLVSQMEARAARMSAAGITTARDLGGGQWLELGIRDRINAGGLTGPRLICAGQPVTSPGGHCHFWGGEAATGDEASEVIARQIAHHVDLIKVMATGGNLTPGSQPVDAQFDTATLRRIVAEAAEAGMHVAAHCHGTAGIGNAGEAGVRTVEHCSWVDKNGWARGYDRDVASMLAERGVWVSPTINLGWKRRIGSGEYEEQVRENFDEMRKAGIKLIASTDAGIPGVYHQDLPRALPVFAHFAGLTPVETLRAATSDCAEAIGLGAVAGSVRRGYSADLILLEHNPLEDLGALEAPVEVWVKGIRVRETEGYGK